MPSISRRTLLPLLLCLALPLGMMAGWHWLNIGFPQDDCGEYMNHTLLLYRMISSHVGGFAHSLYFERLWKPVLQPALALPAMFLTHGSVLATAAWMASVYFALSLTYVFLLSRDFLGDWRAAICTLFVAFTPWFFANSVHFDAEAPMLAFSLAALFHLRRARNFEKIGQCAAFGSWFGLALCVRPVESLALFFFPLFLTVLRALRASSGRRLAPRLLLGLGIPFGSAAIWFLPFRNELYGWVYLCTFGKTTQTLHRDPRFLEWVRTVVFRFADFPLLILAALALLGFRASRKLKLETRELTGIAAMGLPLVLCGAASYNPDLRYYLSFGLLLSISACVLALHPEGRFPGLRTTIMGVLVGVQAVFIALAISSSSPVEGCGIGDLSGNGISPVRVTPLSEGLFSELKRLIPRDPQASFSSPDKILFLNIPPGAEAMDADQLGAYSQQEGRYWRFVSLGWFDPIADLGKERVDAEMKKRFDYILIGPLDEKANPNVNFRSRFKERVRKEIASGQKVPPGFRLIGAFNPGTGQESKTLALLCNVSRKACPVAVALFEPIHLTARSGDPPARSGFSSFSAGVLSKMPGLPRFVGCGT